MMNSIELLKLNENQRNSYSVDGNEALELKLVRYPEDIYKDTASFKPDMCHQVFGDSENIFGYKGLKVKLYYAADTLKTYVGMEYDEKIDTPGIQADNVMEMLHNAIQLNFETNLEVFEKLTLRDQQFHPHGQKIYSFRINNSHKERTFEVYFNDNSDPAFLEYLNRVQTFVILYIDAANFVNPDDGNWNFFVLYEKYLSKNMTTKYAFVGYTSVYEYYAYPSHIRPRISQIMILPPFRCMGLCSKLLRSIYEYYYKNNIVIDITVESPSPEFQRVRDFVDACNCQKLVTFSPEKLKFGFKDEMAIEAREKLKLNKKQSRRVYEILRLMQTNIHNDEEYNAWLNDVKERINRPNKKRYLKRKFWAYFGSDPDDLYIPALPADSEENSDSEEQLEDGVQELKEQYELVTKRIKEFDDL